MRITVASQGPAATHSRAFTCRALGVAVVSVPTAIANAIAFGASAIWCWLAMAAAGLSQTRIWGLRTLSPRPPILTLTLARGFERNGVAMVVAEVGRRLSKATRHTRAHKAILFRRTIPRKAVGILLSKIYRVAFLLAFHAVVTFGTNATTVIQQSVEAPRPFPRVPNICGLRQANTMTMALGPATLVRGRVEAPDERAHLVGCGV